LSVGRNEGTSRDCGAGRNFALAAVRRCAWERETGIAGRDRLEADAVDFVGCASSLVGKSTGTHGHEPRDADRRGDSVEGDRAYGFEDH
jgi:hypothetical protein